LGVKRRAWEREVVSTGVDTEEMGNVTLKETNH
jgi:hypothetical protein